MSSGRIHNTISIISSISLGGINLYQTGNVGLTLALIVGGIFNLFINPDWDVDGGSKSDHHARKIGLGWLFGIFRKPYSIGYKHRSFITHFPLISTVFRIIYLYLPLIVIRTQNQHPNDRVHIIKLVFSGAIAQMFVVVLVWLPTWYLWNYLVYYQIYIWYGLLSLVIMDTLHYVFDSIPFLSKLQ